MRSTRSNPSQLREMYAGKRGAGEVSGVTTSSAEDINANDMESRWWLQVSIGNFRFRALYYTEASRTVMGAVGLQMATVLGRPVMPSYGCRAKVVGDQTARIAGYVELPFEVADVK